MLTSRVMLKRRGPVEEATIAPHCHQSQEELMFWNVCRCHAGSLCPTNHETSPPHTHAIPSTFSHHWLGDPWWDRVGV